MSHEIDISGLPEETQAKVRRAQGLHKQNERMMQELVNMGVTGIEPTGQQMNFFFRHMVEMGILTEDQFWSMHVAWEEFFRTSLQEITQQVRTAAARRRLYVPGRD